MAVAGAFEGIFSVCHGTRLFLASQRVFTDLVLLFSQVPETTKILAVEVDNVGERHHEIVSDRTNSRSRIANSHPRNISATEQPGSHNPKNGQVGYERYRFCARPIC